MDIININSAPWQTQLKSSITNPAQLMEYLGGEQYSPYMGFRDKDALAVQKKALKESIGRVMEKYTMRIPLYYLSLIKSIKDPIWKQAVPDAAELCDQVNEEDPLCEGPQSPVSSIIHRYPDRVIFLVSNRCAMYCRHCMRKRKVGSCDKDALHNHAGDLELGLDYIQKNKGIHDVILSGGDPLLLNTESLDRILFRIRSFDHVQTIRIHTRALCTLPSRITENLTSVLKKYHPLYINTHFNHPMEISKEAAAACAMLADAGIPLGCQTVLLKGINDTPEVMTKLMRKLIQIRVRPYYLHHPDPIAGTAHLRPSFETGLQIIKSMRGHLSGIAIPHYVIDLPGGHGKVPMTPDYLKSLDGNRAVVENYQGRSCEYLF